MLEVEPTGRRGCTAIWNGRNGYEAVTGAASEAFARWLHNRYAPAELPSAGEGLSTSRVTARPHHSMRRVEATCWMQQQQVDCCCDMLLS